ncbi:hypothetical protein D3C85_1000350 [compost metagenome]
MTIYALNSQTRWTGKVPFDGDCKIMDSRFLGHGGSIEDLVKETKELVLEMGREKFISPDFSYTMDAIELTRVESEYDQLIDDVDEVLKKIPRIVRHVYSISRERPQPLATRAEHNQLSTYQDLMKRMRRSVIGMVVQHAKNPQYVVDSVGELTELLAEVLETRLIKEYGKLDLPEPYDMSNIDCEEGICDQLGWKPFGENMKLIAMSSYCQEVMPEKFIFDLTALELSDEAVTTIIDNLRNNDDIFVARDPRGLALYYIPVEEDDFSRF